MGPCFRRDDKRGYHLHVSNSPTSSLPGLTRQSILFESALLEDGWMPGSSPGTTSPLSTQLRDLAACFARVLPENSCPLTGGAVRDRHGREAGCGGRGSADNERR